MLVTRSVILMSFVLAAGISAAPAEPLILTFAGDIMHHDTNAAMTDYDRLYDAVRSHLSADTLSFANIEFPVDPGRAPSGYPLFNGTRAYVEAAVRGGFDVFALANNHSFDLGEHGVFATSGEFAWINDSWGTHSNGLRQSVSAPITPTEIRYADWSIAFVSITTFSNEPGSSPYINLVDPTDVPARDAFFDQVAQWDEAYDLVIISVHSGAEYAGEPEPSKVRFFRDLVSHGADIVWGHHPHVLQPWESVNTGTANKLILHSAGNFVSGQRRLQQPFVPLGRWAPTGDTALFRVTVTRAALPDSGGRIQSTIGRVDTPMFTTHADQDHGLILKTFGDVLGELLPLSWRAFYSARYSATLAMLRTPLYSILIRPVIPGRNPAIGPL